MTYDWTTPWRDLPAGRDLDARVSEEVFGKHVHEYERGSANVYSCSRKGCTRWAGGPAPSSDVDEYSTEPRDANRVFEWISEQGWSWEVSYRWGLGYRASLTKEHEPTFSYVHVDDCPSWTLAICRLALAVAEAS